MRKFVHLLALVLCLSLSVIAAPQKHQAYSFLQFGDSKEEFEKHFAQLQQDMVRRQSDTTASDIMKSFVTNGSKYPPKLAAKYSKTPVQLSIEDVEVAMNSISFTTRDDPKTHQHDVKSGWEVFRDIAESKFGKPVEVEAFPDLSQVTQTFTQTHRWKIDGIDILLGIQLRSNTGDTPVPRAVLTARVP